MKKNYYKLLESEILNKLYEKSVSEDFVGSATKNLIEKCQLILYYYPFKNKLINEQNVSDFYLTSCPKIRNTIYNFNTNYSDNFKKYYLNFIKISIRYYKMKLRHDYLFDNLNLEVAVRHSDTFEKEVFYDSTTDNPITIANFKYKLEENEQLYYYKHLDINNIYLDKTLVDLFNEILEIKNDNITNNTFSHLNLLKKRIEKKSTRRSVLLLLLTMPDAILENYVEEVSYVYSTDRLMIIALFSTCRKLQSEKYERFDKYTQLNNKHYKNYLINNYKLTSNLYNTNKLNTSIAWDKKAMLNNADKIRKTLNMHVSQRTLAKALDIKKGTVASSISMAKSVLNQTIELLEA